MSMVFPILEVIVFRFNEFFGEHSSADDIARRGYLVLCSNFVINTYLHLI